MQHFATGDRVEVWDIRAQRWLLATVVRRWRAVAIDHNTKEDARTYTYDVEGEDESGAFWGTWDGQYVRKRSKVSLWKKLYRWAWPSFRRAK